MLPTALFIKDGNILRAVSIDNLVVHFSYILDFCKDAPFLFLLHRH